EATAIQNGAEHPAPAAEPETTVSANGSATAQEHLETNPVESSLDKEYPDKLSLTWATNASFARSSRGGHPPAAPMRATPSPPSWTPSRSRMDTCWSCRASTPF